MKLTPIDIREQEFSRGFRGYQTEEVHTFLKMLAGQWEATLDEVRSLDGKIQELKTRVAHYEKVECALQEALETTRETSRKTIRNAEEKARILIQEAEGQAKQIKQGAEEELREIRRTVHELDSLRSEILVRLGALLDAERNLLKRYERDSELNASTYSVRGSERTGSGDEEGGDAGTHRAAVGSHPEEAGARRGDAGVAQDEREGKKAPASLPTNEAKAAGDAWNAGPKGHPRDSSQDIKNIRRILSGLD